MKQRNKAHGPRQHAAPRPRRGGPAGGPDGVLWLYGQHAAAAALANPARRIARALATANAAQALEAALRAAGVVAEIVRPEQVAAVLPDGAVHQGIALAVRPLAPPDLESVCAMVVARGHGLIVALDQVADPQNVGAVLRSAAAFGADAVIVTQRHAPAVGGTLAKAASGGLEHVPMIAVVNLARALDTLGEHGFLRVGLAGEAETTLAEVPTAARLALVLGAEGAGLRRLTRERCDALARLPTLPAMPSLNVSAAAATALYEFARRR